MTWVSDGYYWRFRPHYGVKTSRGPRNRVDKDAVLIDVDNDVVILDGFDTWKRKDRKSRVADKKDSAADNVIFLDVDDDDNCDFDRCNGAKLDRNLSDGASTSKRSDAGSDNAGSSSHEEADSDGSRFFGEHSGSDSDEDDIKVVHKSIPARSTSERDTKVKYTPPVKLSKGKRTYSGKSTPDSDCELMEDSFIIREQWEKASTKRKLDTHYGQSDAEHPQVNLNEGRQKDKIVNEHYQQEKDRDLENDNEMEDDPDCKILKENVIPVAENRYRHGEADHAELKASSSKEPPRDNDNLSRQPSENDGSSSFTEENEASTKRKLDTNYGQSDAEHTQVNLNEGRQKDKIVNEHYQHEKDRDLESDNEMEDDPDCKILKENVIPVAENRYRHGEADHAENDGSSSFIEEDRENNHPNANEETKEFVSNICLNSGEDAPLHDEDAPLHDEDASDGCMKGDREKYKETDEYKKALAEELAHRDEVLRIQAEAAQNLRRQRKRERAESMRLLDMERRQKQRIQEIRETQKKDEEDMNLKEAIRTSVRRNLLQLELSCYSMSSLLQGLGIIEVGTCPTQSEVRLAYKKALLKFHPDRASRSDMRQQVEAEEKFKLISRMKERFQLVH